MAVTASFGGGRVAGGRHCGTVAVAASKELAPLVSITVAVSVDWEAEWLASPNTLQQTW